MILPYNDMQEARKKTKSPSRSANANAKTPILSSLSLVHHLGRIDFVKVGPRIREKMEQYFRLEDFPGWCMPDQPAGYIKCRNFDFL